MTPTTVFMATERLKSLSLILILFFNRQVVQSQVLTSRSVTNKTKQRWISLWRVTVTLWILKVCQKKYLKDCKMYQMSPSVSNIRCHVIFWLMIMTQSHLDSNFKMHYESDDLNMIKDAVLSLSFHSEMSQVNQRTKAERKVKRV